MKHYFMTALAVIMEVLTLVIGLAILIEIEYNQFYNWGENYSIGNFYLDQQSIDKNNSEIYNTLADVANDNSANLIKTDFTAYDGEMVIEKSFLVTSPESMPSFKLSSDKQISITDFGPNTVASTEGYSKALEGKGIESRNIVGISSILGINQIYIHSLDMDLETDKNLSGKYNVIGATNFQEFIADLADGLNIDQSDLKKENFVVRRIDGNFIILSCGALLLICIISLVIILAYYINEKYPYIGDCKLLGLSYLKIWQNLFGMILALQLVVAFASIIITYLFLHLSSGNLLILAVVGTIPCFIVLAFLGLAYRAIQKYSMVSIINKKRPYRFVLRATILGKSLISITTIVLIFNAVNYLYIYGDEYKIYKAWDEYGDDYSVFNCEVTDVDLSHMAQGDFYLENKYIDFYNAIKKDGAIYTRTRLLRTADFFPLPDFDSSKIERSINTVMLTVNTNYLKAMPIKMPNGSDAYVPENETSAVYLLPESYRDQENDFKYLLGYDRENYVNVSKSLNKRIHNGKELNDSTEIKIYYYKEGQRFFSFDTVVGKETNYYITDPVFLVLTDSNITYANEYDVNAHTGSADSTVKIPSNGLSAEQLLLRYTKEIQENNLEHNITQIQSINSTFEGEIAVIKNSIFLSVLVALVFICLLISINILLVRCEVSGKRKELGVKMLIGFSFFRRFKAPILRTSLLWIVYFFTAYLFISQMHISLSVEFSLVLLFICTVLYLLDALFVFVQSYIFEHKGVSQLTKSS